MSKQQAFDWIEFYNLGIICIENNNPAKQRTGISRFYYSAFCSSRELINKNKTYLNENSKKIMTNEKKGNVHKKPEIY